MLLTPDLTECDIDQERLVFSWPAKGDEALLGQDKDAFVF